MFNCVTQGRAWLLPSSHTGKDKRKVWEGAIPLLPFCCCPGERGARARSSPLSLSPAANMGPLLRGSGAKVITSRAPVCWGSPRAPTHIQRLQHSRYIYTDHTHPHPPSTHRMNRHTASPVQPGKAIHPGLYRSQAQERSATLTARCPPPQRCPPRPVPLTWAGRRRAGSRRPSGGRAGGAAVPPSYGAGRDRTGRHRRCSPASYPCARLPTAGNLFRARGGSTVKHQYN